MVRVETTSGGQRATEHNGYIQQTNSRQHWAIELVSNDTYTAMGRVRQRL
jgi:hypothetical protein